MSDLVDYKDEGVWLMMGDCLERMKEIPDGSISMILADPPYGTTACKWDSVIPLDLMWGQLKRIIKPNGAIVMTASQPFTTALISSNLKGFAFCWVWDKCFAANFVQAKRQPLKDHEDIVIFTKTGTQPLYYPQMLKRDTPIKKGGNKQSNAIPIAQTETAKAFGALGKTYDEKYPTSQIRFSCRDGRGLHPTQKPVALMEYLIKTYTNEGETVLDFTFGSCTTGVAAVNTNRKFIGIEMDKGYFDIGVNRIKEAMTWQHSKTEQAIDTGGC